MQNNAPKQYMTRRLHVIMAVVILCLAVVTPVILIYRQVIQYEYLSAKAIAQQTKDIIIPASRGTIYDRNMNKLAVTADVEQINVDPSQIKSENEGYVAMNLARILGLAYEDVLVKIQKSSQYEVIAREVEREVSDEVRNFVLENNISGVIITPDTKRYYPQGELASNLIGFTGMDGDGLEGFEWYYDEYLRGTSGRVVSARDGTGQEVGFGYEELVEPQDGHSVVLTIDEVVQYFLEKHLQTAQVDNNALEGVSGIVMDVKTGEILAIANTPTYDPNNPFEVVDDSALKRLEELYAESDTKIDEANQELIDAEIKAYKEVYPDEILESGEVVSALNEEVLLAILTNLGIDEEETNERKETARSGLYAEMRTKTWRNKPVMDSFEPGSIFKLITVSIGLESGAIDEGYTFTCTGKIDVADRTISCVSTLGHGFQTLTQTLENSCNPAMIDIAAKIGNARFLEYYKAFGFMDKTGVDLSGETSGIFFSDNNFNEVELAVSSFGQTFTITPLQLISAVSAVVNDGYLVQPHVVKEIIDKDGKIISTTSVEPVKQVISEETSEYMRIAMESVVEIGTGRNAYVKGYRIGGKTSTSEKISKNLQSDEKYYIASFIGVAPMDDPQVAVLVSIDEPQGSSIYGGSIAAPVVARIMTDILPYLGVELEYSESELSSIDITMPNFIDMPASEVSANMNSLGMKYRTIGSGSVVTDQVPSPGSKIPSDSTVILYLGGTKTSELIEVPNLIGYTQENAKSTLEKEGLFLKATGASEQVSSEVTTRGTMQSPKAGTKVVAGTVVTVEFTDKTTIVD